MAVAKTEGGGGGGEGSDLGNEIARVMSLQVMTVYAVAIGEPNFGVAAPLAVGLALLVSIQAGGKFTGMGSYTN